MFAKKRTAIKALLVLALAGVLGPAMAAQVAGTIVNLSGPLLAKKADGTVKVLALRSEVEQGDTLVSEKNTYAQIRFVDNSEITLKPNTTFMVETFAYDAGKPEGDSAIFNLVKGGLRAVTGLLGKRNREKFQLKTPTATIGIRGTTFIAQYVAPGPAARPGVPPGQPPGLYVQVLDGMIMLNNKAGSMQFSTGQFGFTPNLSSAPVMVPNAPALQFSPPVVFGVGPQLGNTAAKPGSTVDCEVR